MRLPDPYGQSLVADLIHMGVAGAAGHVDEPLLSGVARPMLLADYARGAPAIEAFYRNVPYLSWMNVYVGDPLMQVARPFKAGGRQRRRRRARPQRRLPRAAESGPARLRRRRLRRLCDGDFDQDGIVGVPRPRALRARRAHGSAVPGSRPRRRRRRSTTATRSLLHVQLGHPPGPGRGGGTVAPLRGKP
jgi:hypothetical protein